MNQTLRPNILFFTCAVLCVSCIGLYYLRYSIIIYNTRYGHLIPIQYAIRNYATKYRKLPTSLAEIVEVDALPKSGKIYYSPLQHNSLFVNDVLPFNKCEYEFVFSPTAINIQVPYTVWQKNWSSKIPYADLTYHIELKDISYNPNVDIRFKRRKSF